MSSNISDKENIENTFQTEEESTYPSNNNIIYRERVNNVTKRSFNYIILKEGVYPNEITNKKQINNDNTKKKRLMRHYKIPNNYVVETTWGRASKKRTVRCEIIYINNTPQFWIKYGFNFQHAISSTKSASDVASNYEKVSSKIIFIIIFIKF